MPEHLTDEQLTDLFFGEELKPEVRAHIGECAACRKEIASLQDSFGDLRSLGTHWATTEAPRRIHTPSRLRLHPGLRWAARGTLGATAACATLAVALHLPSLHSSHPQVSLNERQTPSKTELAKDNAWLQAMDRDLRYGPDSVEVTAEGTGRYGNPGRARVSSD